MGAWIETRVRRIITLLEPMSHPVWVRGLKQSVYMKYDPEEYVAPRVGAWIETEGTKIPRRGKTSHPVWVRGLKQKFGKKGYENSIVAPRVGAWIETQQTTNGTPFGMSHPVWVRGLKRFAGHRNR